MLEPTHQCNLSCQGCGRIQEYRDTLGQSLTLEECLGSVDECGAPVVTITGGEPLIYPPVFELLEELVRRQKHIYLCSNAVLLERSLPKIPVSDRITLSVHLDGLAATHDRLLGRPGLFNTAIKAIKAAKAQGHRVCTNTSIYKETDPREIEILFSYLGHIGVDGLLVSPAYSFAGVEDELFLSREEIKEKFTRLPATAIISSSSAPRCTSASCGANGTTSAPPGPTPPAIPMAGARRATRSWTPITPPSRR